jgi:hypothetical protein
MGMRKPTFSPLLDDSYPLDDLLIKKLLRQPIAVTSPPVSMKRLSMPMGVKSKLIKVTRKKKPLTITSNLKPYDIMKDLDILQSTISMKQLLAVAPECRSTLYSSLIRRRQRNKEICEVSLSPNPDAPTIDVSIDGVTISGV